MKVFHTADDDRRYEHIEYIKSNASSITILITTKLFTRQSFSHWFFFGLPMSPAVCTTTATQTDQKEKKEEKKKKGNAFPSFTREWAERGFATPWKPSNNQIIIDVGRWKCQPSWFRLLIFFFFIVCACCYNGCSTLINVAFWLNFENAFALVIQTEYFGAFE